MTKRGLIAAGAIATSALATVVACLPDLDPLPSAADAAAVPAPFDTCGDDLIAFSSKEASGESCDPGDADVAGCTRCHVTCEGRLDESSDHCYFAAGVDDSYSAAIQRCLLANAHVVTVASPEEARFVDGLAGGGATMWVGLARNLILGAYAAALPTEPGWPIAPLSGPCTGCFAASEGIFDDDAADSGATLDCLAATAGRWRRVPCGDAGPITTVCEREPPGLRLESCGGVPCVTVPFTAASKTYLVFESPEPEDVAAKFCESLGDRLVIFDSRQEREQLARELEKLLRDPRRRASPPLTFWIGLRRVNGTWQWEDGASADDGHRPLPWGNAQPAAGDGARAYLHLRSEVYDSQLAYADDDAGALARRGFLCEKRR